MVKFKNYQEKLSFSHNFNYTDDDLCVNHKYTVSIEIQIISMVLLYNYIQSYLRTTSRFIKI